MPCVQWLKNTLELSRTPYSESHHHVAITAQELAQREHISGHLVAKTVAINIDGVTVLLVLPASRMVSFDKIKEIARTPKVRLLTEGEMLFDFPECEIGAIPPMRHWPETDLWVDYSILQQDEIVFPGGTHESSIRMPLSDWKRIAKPRAEDFSCPLEQGALLAGEEERWRDKQISVMESESEPHE